MKDEKNTIDTGYIIDEFDLASIKSLDDITKVPYIKDVTYRLYIDSDYITSGTIEELEREIERKFLKIAKKENLRDVYVTKDYFTYKLYGFNDFCCVNKQYGVYGVAKLNYENIFLNIK